MENQNNKKPIIIGAVILAVLLVVFGVVYLVTKPATQKGSKNITIEVVASDGNKTDYELATDAEYLRTAMDELVEDQTGFSYDGTDAEYGIMIEYICGERASYTEDGAYWALYVNGEYGQFGCDQQPVTDGDTYTWTYELAQ